MKSGVCPKCGSDDIYVSKPQQIGPQGTNYGKFIHISGFLRRKYAGLIHYACANCNYIESYIAKDGSMKNIVEAWQPLNKQKRKNDER